MLCTLAKTTLQPLQSQAVHVLASTNHTTVFGMARVPIRRVSSNDLRRRPAGVWTRMNGHIATCSGGTTMTSCHIMHHQYSTNANSVANAAPTRLRLIGIGFYPALNHRVETHSWRVSTSYSQHALQCTGPRLDNKRRMQISPLRNHRQTSRFLKKP